MNKFPPIFCISLTRATARRAAMTKRLDALGFPYQIIDAVDGATLDLSQFGDRLRLDKFRRKFGRDMLPGEIGCFLSHYNLWESLIATGEEYALVLEDDVDLSADFAAVVADVVALELEWDVVLLHTPRKHRVDSIVRKMGGGDYALGRPKRRLAGTAGYLIRLRGARRLHEYCREINSPIDIQYGEWWRSGLVFYCLYPKVVLEMEPESTIGKTNYRDASLQERLIASCWRKWDRQCRRIYRWTHPIPKMSESKK